jgi:hypothetical protein
MEMRFTASIWSRSYSLFSVGGRAPIDVLLRYIQEQDAYDDEKQKAVAAR